MLLTNSLFFTRISRLEDPVEGKLTHYDIEIEQKGMEYLKSRWGENWTEITGDATPERRKFQEKLRKESIINCWHMNDYESALMWKSYSGYNYGIAIQSTVERLDDSFKIDYPVDIRTVKYLDYVRQGIGKNQIKDEQLFTKRTSFKHEQEIRAVIRPNFTYSNGKSLKISSRESGKQISVDLNSLIEKIYISSVAKPWFVRLVKSITKIYLPDKKVEQSPLYSLK